MTDRDDRQDRSRRVIDQRTDRLDEEGDEVMAVWLSTGDRYIPVRPFCAILGRESSGRVPHIRQREALAEMLRIIFAPAALKNSPLSLSRRRLRQLSGVDTRRVTETLHARLIDAQR